MGVVHWALTVPDSGVTSTPSTVYLCWELTAQLSICAGTIMLQNINHKGYPMHSEVFRVILSVFKASAPTINAIEAPIHRRHLSVTRLHNRCKHPQAAMFAVA